MCIGAKGCKYWDGKEWNERDKSKEEAKSGTD
jgi:hypothetical protein